MKALISNDDGIYASGILAAKKAVEDMADVIVVAPETQQSGIGRALTLFKPLRINEVKLRDGSMGYSVSGTPTDSVTLGLFKILKEKPDIVVSGINTGHNIGKAELTTSGTIGAAMEASTYGIPAIAISQQVDKGHVKFENGAVDIDFSFAQKILKKVVKIVLNKGLPKGIDLLNLNIPENPESDEIKVVKLGERMYTPSVETRLDPRGKPYYWIDGIPYDDDLENTDGHCLKKENVSTLTPLSIDTTANIELLKEWIL
jgi:5'-nucleotidase